MYIYIYSQNMQVMSLRSSTIMFALHEVQPQIEDHTRSIKECYHLCIGVQFICCKTDTCTFCYLPFWKKSALLRLKKVILHAAKNCKKMPYHTCSIEWLQTYQGHAKFGPQAKFNKEAMRTVLTQTLPTQCHIIIELSARFLFLFFSLSLSGRWVAARAIQNARAIW